MFKKLSYFIFGGIILLSIFVTPTTEASRMFINYDTVFVTTGAGTEFELELRVDEDVKSLKLFVVELNFDSDILEKIGETEGDFWDTTGAMTDFGCYYKNEETLLRIEGLVLGAGISADGPGWLGTVHLNTVGPGKLEMFYDYYSLKNVNGDPIPTTAEGTVVFVDYPPDSFDLLTPIALDTVSRLSGGSFDCIWNSTQSVYPGESIIYKLEMCPSSNFVPESTMVFTDLTDTSATILADDLNDLMESSISNIFWRVTATGDMYGFEKNSTPFPKTFIFSYGVVAPDPFDITSPTDSTLIDLRNYETVFFDWEDANSINPDDTVKYVIYIGPEPTFPGSEIFKDSIFDISEISVLPDLFPLGKWENWQVLATNRYGLSRWSTSVFTTMFFLRGDVNNDNKLNISDITFLVSYLFGGSSSPEPVPKIAGDMNCDDKTNISDITFLVSYLFGDPSGPEPICP